MLYRSDWPELGLSFPTDTNRLPGTNGVGTDNNQGWIAVNKKQYYRWIARKNEFESELYYFPVYNFHLEILWTGTPNDHPVLWNREEISLLRKAAEELTRKPPWQGGYAVCKVVKNEPLYPALLAAGFEEIEQRSIYKCPVGTIKIPVSDDPVQIRYTSFAKLPVKAMEKYKHSILEICRLSFAATGLSRHFSDPYLLRQKAGIDYILAIMEMNFSQCLPQHILVAVDKTAEQVCGFTIIGKKRGFPPNMYSQLLSAVHPDYRGHGIYHRLTELLVQTLPRDALLLNVTHTGNKAIRRAYEKSNRTLLENTVIVRRFF